MDDEEKRSERAESVFFIDHQPSTILLER